MTIQALYLLLVLAPLAGALVAGFFRQQLGRKGATFATLLGVGLSLILSVYFAYALFSGRMPVTNANLYTWASGGFFFPYSFHVGFLLDPLSVTMLLVVNFVSFLVHVYSIGYMADDEGYQRFFSYISLFTFMMLMLVTSNNFLQLFFGWEGVGLVSYLLISFWYSKESALAGGLKAFVVNRVGDFGFILGIALIFSVVGSLDYSAVFAQASFLSQEQINLIGSHSWSLATVICLLLFVGAMGKSAQVPLHVWLPESMEGPTPISALIHAATMVTAGVFMLARISPLLEFSVPALSFILVIGATGALFTGILALVMNDIKRVVAYSTLSQLGYMMVAMGASAYEAGMFHLVTHACFKALLFLGAGSVIIAMHHEQDMRKMGGLWKKMPITYLTVMIGSLALTAIPPFSGFFSKDSIIEAAHLSTIPGSHYAYICVTLGAMFTAIYTFRLLFLTFHGQPRMSEANYAHVHESPWVVWLPLVILAIPSFIIGFVLYQPMLTKVPNLFSPAIVSLRPVLAEMAKEAASPWQLMHHGVKGLPFWLSILGIVLAWLFYIAFPRLPAFFAAKFSLIYRILCNKYGFDSFNDRILVPFIKGLGQLFYQVGDKKMIDGLFVNGSGKTVRWLSTKGKSFQSGYLYQYVGVMIFALGMLLCWVFAS